MGRTPSEAEAFAPGKHPNASPLSTSVAPPQSPKPPSLAKPCQARVIHEGLDSTILSYSIRHSQDHLLSSSPPSRQTAAVAWGPVAATASERRHERALLARRVQETGGFAGCAIFVRNGKRILKSSRSPGTLAATESPGRARPCLKACLV